ncbi:MAG: hypothetical protein JSV31_28060 [Desulfobacterales bacterium]|nr:MAG: hypothetical protein JSV31_28060 [Desulfobacterales bacterium]
MLRSLKYICFVCLLLSVINCASSNRTLTDPSNSNYPADINSVTLDWDRVNALEYDLAALNHNSDGTEARRVAETALQVSAILAKEYRLVRPPILHNLFIQMGLRDRGLCYQWTEDLMSRLKTLQLKSYQLRWGVAYRGSDLREHNTVVITANGQPFEDGLILDPWRHSGKLYWVVVKKDRYPWRELPPEEW